MANKKVAKKATKKKVQKKTTKEVDPNLPANGEGYVMGRPTTYEERFCKDLVVHMSKGYSFESFGGEVFACKQTLYNWSEKHDYFMDAKKIGEELSRRFWEGMAIEHLLHYMNGTQLNTPVWIFKMRNRFGWTDKQEISIENGSDNVFQLAYNLGDRDKKAG